jgi:hypothetical protein
MCRILDSETQKYWWRRENVVGALFNTDMLIYTEENKDSGL